MCLSAFILGLVGGLHCAGMCGPLVLALNHSKAGKGGFLLSRFVYQAGRISTYCLLGLVFGLAGKTIWLAGIQRWLSIGLGIILLASLIGATRMASWVPVTTVIAALKARMSALLRQRSLASYAALGWLNGFLPCGLVYVAGAGALSTGQALKGVQYMAAFGLGTLPMMLAISLSGKLVPPNLRFRLRKAVPVSIAVLAFLLILRGSGFGIPWLSPSLSPEGWSCCHREQVATP